MRPNPAVTGHRSAAQDERSVGAGYLRRLGAVPLREELVKRVLVALALVLCSCATDPIPKGYTGPRASIVDTVMTDGSSKGEFFYVSEIDGKQINESLSATRGKSRGRGFHMEVEIISREVPVRPMKVRLEGRVAYAAPILELAHLGSMYSTFAVIEFEPAEGHKYVVKGTLGESGSEVWLEDVSDSKRVGTSVPQK